MTKFERTKEFFSEGGIVFGSRKGFLARAVAGLGLAAMVSVMPSPTADSGKEFAHSTSQITAAALDLSSNVDVSSSVEDKAVHENNVTTVELKVGALANPVVQGFFDKLQTLRSGVASKLDVVPDMPVDVATVVGETVDYLELMAKKISVGMTTHQFGEYEVPHYVASEFIRAAKDFEFDIPTLFAISEKESSFRFNAEAKTSSATGWFQPLKQTWLESVKLRGHEVGLQADADMIEWNARTKKYEVADTAHEERILTLRNDPYTSAALTILKLKEDQARISDRIGRDLAKEEIYLPHFLGTSGAAKLLASSDSKPNATAAALFPKAAKSNRNMFRAGGKQLTVRQFHEQAKSIIGDRAPKYENVEFVVARKEATVWTASYSPELSVTPGFKR